MDEQQTNGTETQDAAEPVGMECQVCGKSVAGIHAAKDTWLPLASHHHAPACPFYAPVAAQVEPDPTDEHGGGLSALDGAHEAVAQSLGCVRVAMSQTTDEAVLKHLRGLADSLDFAHANIAHHSALAAQAKTNAQGLIGLTGAFFGGALAGHALTLPKEPGRGVSSLFDSLTPEMIASGANLLQAWLATHRPSDPARDAPPPPDEPEPVVTPPPASP